MNFNYNLPVNLIFGRGRVNEIGGFAASYGTKALIVTGHSSTKDSGLLQRTTAYLKESGVDSIVFDKVSKNPLTTTAQEGAALAVSEECGLVIGLGGGSIMDCAKAIAFIAVNEGDINDYIFGKLLSDKALPIILVPTTCGTGSEGNGFAVLTNPKNGDKKSLRCQAIVAKVSIIDSECMMTMPKSILASVGFDALCHCMEAYLSRNAQPVTDALCLQGMELIGRYLLPLYQGSIDPDAWDALSWASTIGGMAIHSAGVTAAHGMEHPASGLRNIVHGNGLAALVPVVFEESIAGCPEKFAEISKCIGGKDENDCISRLRLMLEDLSLQTTLSEQGVKAEDVDWMVENCLKVSAASMANHPVIFDSKAIRRIYLKAI